MNFSKIPEKLLEFVREESKKAGYELVDVIAKGSRTFFIEIVLDKKGGITLRECIDFNKKIASWVNLEDVFTSKVALDVCSPGLDRELKSESSFLWGKDKYVEVRGREAAGGKHIVSGKLIERNSSGDVFLEMPDGKAVCIDSENVIKVKLKVESNR